MSVAAGGNQTARVQAFLATLAPSESRVEQVLQSERTGVIAGGRVQWPGEEMADLMFHLSTHCLDHRTIIVAFSEDGDQSNGVKVSVCVATSSLMMKDVPSQPQGQLGYRPQEGKWP